MPDPALVALADIEAAAARLRPYVQPTPTVRSRLLSERLGGEVYLKQELFQRGGSFKLRGALNRILTLSPAERARGVIAASAGNHAQGVAIASGIAGCRATVVMPESAPLAKVAATADYGARVVLHGSNYDEAHAHALALAAAEGLTYIHAFDDPAVIAGQGTVALEMLAAVPDLEALVVPVGGGGLASGVGVVAKARRSPLRVYGVQAAGAAAAVAAFRTGVLAPLAEVRTFADGIAVKAPGPLTLAHLRAYCDELLAVDDDRIAEAIVLLMERNKLVVEGAGAVGVAALLAGALAPLRGRRVGIVLSGGNIDLTTIDRVVQHGLTAAGRYLVFRTRLEERPGELARLSALLARTRANILEVRHYVRGVALGVNEVDLELTVETRNAAHGEEILAQLRAAGYRVATGYLAPEGAPPAPALPAAPVGDSAPTTGRSDGSQPASRSHGAAAPGA
ncbi:MAG TPA: threonine ammonia-lyase [Chloroflexota bacterium]|nr:threonine ammonia-lyase [Chloroflexota bacterium]